MKMMSKHSAVFKWTMHVMFLLLVVLVEGCGSGYEVNESNGRVYVQRKSWWERMFFGP